MSNWKSFERTVSLESWKRIKLYIEDAQTGSELSDYPNVSTWYDMTSILSMYENGLAVDGRYDSLIEDYKLYWEIAGDISQY